MTVVFQYSKRLGSRRPASVVRFESVIWKALFNMARGNINVYDAAQSIVDAIPVVLQNSGDDDGSWFSLGESCSFLYLSPANSSQQ